MPLTTLTRIKIDKLKDVDTVSTAPSNGQALVWSVAQNNWIPGNVASGGGGGSLVFDTFTGDGVEDTFTLSEPQPTEATAILVYIDGVIQPPVTAYTLSGGDIVFAEAPPLDTSINVLQLPGGGGGGSITVKDEGTTLTSAASTVNFVGSGVTATNVGSTVTVTIPSGGSAGPLNDLTDVVITSASTGQVLKYDGTNWINSTDSMGTTISGINDIGDVVITSAATGQVLKYDGTNWVNSTDATGSAGLTFEELLVFGR